MSIPIPKTPRRMSATDAGFLYLDRPHAPLQIASLVWLSGSICVEELAGRIEARIARAPRFAQRAMRVPLALGHPTWEDAPDFDAREHVQRWVLPDAAGDYDLCELAARLLVQPLPADRPLWEMHLIERRHDGRSALLIKAHHCMADGLAGVQLLDAILDPVPSPGIADRRRTPPPATLRPGAGARAVRALGENLRSQIRSAVSAAKAVRHPSHARASAQRLLDATRCALRLATHEIRALPWNQRIGARRALYFTRLPLEAVRRVRSVHGGTVNDVVLCALAGGLHRYLEAIGIRTNALELLGLVPVSLRRQDEIATPCNRISAILAPLAVHLDDELARLRATVAITEQLKASSAWTGIEALLDLAERLPAGMLEALVGGIGSLRIAHVVATNVPGPREQRFLCSRPVEEIYPVVPIADGLGLGLAVFSYHGSLHVGLNADPALVPDLEKLGHCIEGAFEELCARSRD